MLKKIAVKHLQHGMYVHALCGSWLSHPFWRSAFLIGSQALLQKLRAGAIREVWIDTDRGRDIAGDIPYVADGSSVSPPLLTADIQPITLSKELRRATEVCRQSQRAVMDLFREARLGQALDLHVAHALVEEITASMARNPDALLSVSRLKTVDNYTYMHSVAVSALMTAFGRNLGMNPDQLRQAAMAGLLHDLGKVRMRPEVLNKPGALNAEEFAHMRTHPQAGYELLQDSAIDPMVLDACLHHHERLDGKGYPHGLAGNDIQPLARMVAICDIYDAVTSDRPYKKAWLPDEALSRMHQWCDVHLDLALFEIFVQTIGIYPIGALVRLESGLLALVCSSSQNGVTSPQVVAFYCTQEHHILKPPRILDLAEGKDRISNLENPNQWPFKNLHSLWQKAVEVSTA